MPENIASQREKKITQVSIVGIVVNILLGVVKFVFGSLTKSIAIVSDAVNNLTDSSSSIITIIGTKLAAKKPTREHPFGYGRIEYLTSIIISVMILITGAEMLMSSIKAIIHPEEVNYSIASIAILAVTVVVKTILGSYFQKNGRDIQSDALIASGADAKNDALVSLITIASAAIFLLTGFSLDAIAGAVISAFILKTGFDILKDTLDKILGERADAELAEAIKETVRSRPEILGAHDLILHNYGPGKNTGSMNVEIEHKTKLSDLYPMLHSLQNEIYTKYHTYLVFGVYSINKNHPKYKKLIKAIDSYLDGNTHCLGYHGLDIDDERKMLFCDFVLDFDTDRAAFKADTEKMFSELYPDYTIVVTIDTEFA
ncbi:MAG: cation transporter [Lachnospiraceae bacterium]|nr:cation transporter [Lachnospiraceae bacterium]